MHGSPEAVHADSGPAMRSTLLKGLLGDRGVTQTHNRPRAPNDNPFSESESRTMKCRPDYPGTLTDSSRACLREGAAGLRALETPGQVDARQSTE